MNRKPKAILENKMFFEKKAKARMTKMARKRTRGQSSKTFYVFGQPYNMYVFAH
jgi:hypothetical protein